MEAHTTAVQAEVVANFATHPSLPIALAKLGEIKYNAGDFRGADKDWEDALAVLRQTPEGEMHPAAGRVYGNLGAVALDGVRRARDAAAPAVGRGRVPKRSVRRAPRDLPARAAPARG